MLLYDNLDDAQGKLTNTMCYYQGKAVLVKAVDHVYNESTGHPEEGFRVALFRVGDRKSTWINLDDPEFNCMIFNIGYTNHSTFAPWWYRVPKKQYQQGLRSGQMAKICSGEYNNYPIAFEYNNNVIDMMENRYPDFDRTEMLLKNGHANILAFHKDFAATYDKIHDDLIIEYKGQQIGHMISRSVCNLMSEYKYLEETLKEAVG